MRKGISFYWGFPTNIEYRAQLIKNAGFDSVITSADKKFKKQNGNIKQQINLFKKYNITPSSLHMRYNSNQLGDLWKKGFKGFSFCYRLKKDIMLAKKYGFLCVVVHLKGEPNKLGYKRLNKILNLCQKVNIPLALENTNDQNCFIAVFNNVKHDYLKFCYDIGHNNAFDPTFDYLEKYGDKLICLHLHDNKGTHDDHTLRKYGTIDWNNFAKKLRELNFNGCLDYEILMCYKENDTCEEVVNQTYEDACYLEKLINS